MKPLSIIIPALNEEGFLPTLLQSFIDQDYDGQYEIIVVDGASTDGTVDVVARFQAQLPNLSVYSCPRGISKQRNFGVTKARFDAIMFLDADMWLPPNTLRKMAKHLQTKPNLIATPVLFTYAGKLVDIPLGLFGLYYFWRARRTHPVVTGMCIITTKQIHDRIDGFDERVAFAEDVDYGLRAVRSGAHYYILYDVIVRSSARRFDKMGRLALSKLWISWHKQTATHGPIRDASQYDYEFGNFKAKRRK